MNREEPTVRLHPLVHHGSLANRFRWHLHGLEVLLRGPRLVRRDVPEVGLAFMLPTQSLLGRLIRIYGMYEEMIVNWLIKRQDSLRGGVFVDLGGNIGWHTCLFGRLAGPEGIVFSFEPDPTNFALLSRNVALNKLGNVHLVNAAAGEAAGKGTLHLAHASNPGAHTLLPGQYHVGDLEVSIVAPDDIVLPVIGPDRPIAVVKVDIEGYELLALRGCKEILARAAMLIVEFSPERMRAGGLEPAELVALLRAQGFGSLYKFVPEGPPRPIELEHLLLSDFPTADILCLRAPDA